MKEITIGAPNFVPSISNKNWNLRDWQECSSSFDDILKHVIFIAYCNNEADVMIVYNMLDVLYKLESKMGKVTIEVKAITDAKWNKYLKELNMIRYATWPYVETDISILKVISCIKALLSTDN